MAEISQSSLSFVKCQATQKSINIMYAEAILLSKIFADPRRLKQILVNLLSNAVKFTPGMAKSFCRLRRWEEDLVQFSVIDNGIGIDLRFATIVPTFCPGGQRSQPPV